MGCQAGISALKKEQNKRREGMAVAGRAFLPSSIQEELPGMGCGKNGGPVRVSTRLRSKEARRAEAERARKGQGLVGLR